MSSRLLAALRTSVGIQTEGVPAALWWLSAGMVIQSMGFSFFWPFVTIYVHYGLHRSLADAGLLLLLQSAASILGSWVGGLLYDRIGGRQVTIWSLVASIALFVALALVRPFWMFTALSAALGLTTGLIWPAMNAWAGSVWPEGGRSAFNLVYVARNLGVAVGTMFGGLVAEVSLAVAFLAAALFFALFLLIVLVRFSGPGFEHAVVVHRSARGPRSPVAAPVVMLSLGMAVLWIAYSQMSSILPTFMRAEGYSLPQYSLLWTLNGVLIVVGQPLVSWFVVKTKDIRHHILTGTTLMVAGFVVLAATTSYLGYLAAMALATFGEMLVFPGVPAAADRLATDEVRGRYQGIIAAASSVGRMFGPLVGGLVASAVARPSYYLLMTVGFVFALALFALVSPAREERVGVGVHASS